MHILLRSKNMKRIDIPYTPGWDIKVSLLTKWFLKALWPVGATGLFMILRGIGMLDSRILKMLTGQPPQNPTHGMLFFCLYERIFHISTGHEGLDRHFGQLRPEKERSG